MYEGVIFSEGFSCRGLAAARLASVVLHAIHLQGQCLWWFLAQIKRALSCPFHERRSLRRTCRHCSRCLAHRRTPSLVPIRLLAVHESAGRAEERAQRVRLRKIPLRQAETSGLLDRPVFRRKPL